MPLPHGEKRYEILNGEIVYMTPSPSYNHNVIGVNLVRIFSNYFRGKLCSVHGDNMDIYLSENDIVIPDLTIVCDRDKIKSNGIHGSPDLIVEILSPSTAKNDVGYKKNLYEKHGVKEYWIVSPAERSIQVYALENDLFQLENVYALYPDEQIELMSEADKETLIYDFTPVSFSDLTIDLREVFEKML